MHPYQFLLFGVRMPGADHPPGFMTVLAGFSWLGFRSFFQHQVISCLIGATGVAAMGVAGRRIAGERVGLIVAVLAALSPNLFYFDAMVVSESMMVATTAGGPVGGVPLVGPADPAQRTHVRGGDRGRRPRAVRVDPARPPDRRPPRVVAPPRRPSRRLRPRADRMGAAARRGRRGGDRRHRPMGGVQPVPLRGADHAVGPTRPDHRHRQLRDGLRGRPRRLLVAVLHPGDRAPGARGRRLGAGPGLPRDRRRLRPRPPRPGALRGRGPGRADRRPLPAAGAAAARQVGRPEGDRARPGGDGGLVRHRRRGRHRPDRPAPGRTADLPDRGRGGQRDPGGGPGLRQHAVPPARRAGADGARRRVPRRRRRRCPALVEQVERRATRRRRGGHRQSPGPRVRRRRRSPARSPSTPRARPRTPPPTRPAAWARPVGGSPGSTACGRSPPSASS